MANVKITETFIHAAQRAAEATYKNRIEQAKKFFVDEDQAARLVVSAALEQKGVTEHWNKLPAAWLHQSSAVCYATLNGYKFSKDSLRFSGGAVPVPAAMGNYSGREHINHPSLDEFAEKFKAWESEQFALEKEQREFSEKIKTFLRRHVSLKQALLEWPEFWDLVPNEYRETYLKTPEKRVREVAPTDIDFADMNAKLVVAKIVEGNNA